MISSAIFPLSEALSLEISMLRNLQNHVNVVYLIFLSMKKFMLLVLLVIVHEALLSCWYSSTAHTEISVIFSARFATVVY